MGAVAPSHFLTVLNGSPIGFSVAKYDKANGERLENTTLDDFLATGSYPENYMFDPRCLYDAEAGGWLACAVDGKATGSQKVILAVKNSTDPALGSWTKHVLNVDRSGWESDFPTLGVDKNGLYVSVFHFQRSGENVLKGGHTVVAIKKPAIYGGTLYATYKFVSESDLNTWAIQPVVNFDSSPTGGYAWFVAKGPAVASPYQGGSVRYRRMAWNGNSADWVGTSWSEVGNSAYRGYFDLDDKINGTAVFSAPQRESATVCEGSVKIDLNRNGSRVTMAVIRNNTLWTCQQVGLDGGDGDYDGGSSGSTTDRSGVQWLKFSAAYDGSSLSYSAHGRIYDTASASPYFYYVPSLMVNGSGDMMIGFSGSKRCEYIGAFCSWRLASGSSPSRSLLVEAGRAYNSANTYWGDYSYTSLDPSDGTGRTFWTIQAYAHPDAYRWGTWITKLKIQ